MFLFSAHSNLNSAGSHHIYTPSANQNPLNDTTH